MRRSIVTALVLVASLAIAAPVATAGGSSHASPTVISQSRAAGNRSATLRRTTADAPYISALQVQTVRAEIASARRKLMSDRVTLIALIRTDTVLVRQLTWPVVAQAIREAMPAYRLTAAQARPSTPSSPPSTAVTSQLSRAPR